MPYEVTDEFLGTRVKPDGIIPGDYVRNINTGQIGWVFNQWHIDKLHKIVLANDELKMTHWGFDEVELVACRWPNEFTRYCNIKREV